MLPVKNDHPPRHLLIPRSRASTPEGDHKYYATGITKYSAASVTEELLLNRFELETLYQPQPAGCSLLT